MKTKTYISNTKVITTLDPEAFQLIVLILQDHGYENLAQEIFDKTKVKKYKPTIITS